jgi:hypothetical protein
MRISKVVTADHEFYVKLAVLNVENNDWGRSTIDSRINQRFALQKRINDCAVDGKIWVAESGMDCDCVEYTHSAYQIEASIQAYDGEYDRIAEWADGRFNLIIYKADDLPEAYSRDLALEAFENGHPYSIRN